MAGQITPIPAALQAYRSTQAAAPASVLATGAQAPSAASGPGFGAALESALQVSVDQGNAAEAQSRQAIIGQGNLLDVVTAVSKAELSLQTTVAVRDRVIQAYQDIMHMSI